MPGLLSSVFADGSDDGPSQAGDQTYAANADGGIDLSPEVGVSHHAEGNWQDADGTQHDYASDTDVGLTLDVAAAAGATGSLTQSGFEEA